MILTLSCTTRVSAAEEKAECSTMIYGITGNIEHSGLERKGNGVIICRLLNVATCTCTHILLSIKCTPTQTSNEFLKRFGYTMYATNPAFPTGTYALKSGTTICSTHTYIVLHSYVHTVHHFFLVYTYYGHLLYYYYYVA